MYAMQLYQIVDSNTENAKDKRKNGHMRKSIRPQPIIKDYSDTPGRK